MTEPRLRQPHAALDPSGRLPKAEKIERLLGLHPIAERRLRLLEIGTGSGVIAHYFATHPRLDCEVDAVDVVDQRQVTEGFRYRNVTDATLPFASASFDAVISNHVIEHVGDRSSQLAHLREIARVMDPQGSVYLATPNRWQLVEPHYHLAFLSWLPRFMRSPYLRLCRRGRFYDCEPLTMSELEAMLSTGGFHHRNLCEAAIRTMRSIEPDASLGLRVASRMPRGWLQRLRRLSPTHVYLLQAERAGR